MSENRLHPFDRVENPPPFKTMGPEHHVASGQPLPPPPNVDPWKHRAAGMKCRTCMWYVPKVGVMNATEPMLGRCRRHAPTMNGYPAVYPDDWCGDHKLDEYKVGL